MASQLHINFYLTHLFKQMCSEAGCYPAKKCLVIINNKNVLNATLYLHHQRVILTKYDLEHLSQNDIKSLLAHEVGHWVYYKTHTNNVDWTSIQIGVITLIFVLLSILVGKNNLILVNLFATFSVLIVPFMLNISQSFSECLADNIGAKLVGYNNMIHVLVKSNNYEVNQYNQLREYAKLLWTCPLAELHIKWLMIKFRMYYIFRFLHCTEHPSYSFRIRYLRHASKKHVS